MVTAAERIAHRYAIECRARERFASEMARVARGPLPAVPQAAQILRVLHDLDRSKIFTDFDLMSGLFKMVGRSPLVDPEIAQDAKRLSLALGAVHSYMRTYVGDLVLEAQELINRLEEAQRAEAA